MAIGMFSKSSFHLLIFAGAIAMLGERNKAVAQHDAATPCFDVSDVSEVTISYLVDIENRTVYGLSDKPKSLLAKDLECVAAAFSGCRSYDGDFKEKIEKVANMALRTRDGDQYVIYLFAVEGIDRGHAYFSKNDSAMAVVEGVKLDRLVPAIKKQYIDQ
jgi:hypothetical protein